MANIKSILVSAALIAAGSVVFARPAQAAECKIDPVKDGQLTLWNISDSTANSTVNGNTLTTKVLVTGDEDCEKSASIGVWQWPTANGLPVSGQVLYKSTTATFGPGEHTLSIDVPECQWQADVMEGTRATAADGTADYQIGDPSNPNSDRFLDVAYGGNGVCFADESSPENPVPTAKKQSITRLPNAGVSGTASAAVASVLSAITTVTYTIVRKFKN